MPDPIFGMAGSAPGTALSQAVIAQFATANTAFAATGSATVGNSVAEATLVGTVTVGSSIPANTFIAGKTLNLCLAGFITNTVTPTLRIRVKIGGATVLDTTAFTMTTIVGTNLWTLMASITSRSVGAASPSFAQGLMSYFSAGNLQQNQQMVNNATFNLNTTVINAVEVTAQWGAADPLNTLTCTNLSAVLLG